MRRFVTTCAALLLVLPAARAQRGGGDAPQPGVGLTVYNQNFGIVRDTRRMELAAGRGTLTVRDIAETIVPESVQFFSLTDPEGTTVLEQNYEFDLVGASKLLEKYIDEQVRLVLDDGSTAAGNLMSFDAGQIVLDTGKGIAILPRGDNVKTIRFESLPEGLMTRPALVWTLEAQRGGEHLVRLAYRANNMTWRCDYRAVASADLETIDLGGWVTVTNKSGARFVDAKLKLMAGDLNIVEDKVTRELGRKMRTEGQAGGAGGGFQEKAFAEYHLYTLGRPTTLGGKETKQIRLMTVEGIPVTKRYEYRGGRNVNVVLEFDNAEETAPGLGIPLPKGKVRLFTRDRDGEAEYLRETDIDHTPKKEPVKIPAGKAFGILGERTQVWQKQIARQVRDYRFRIRLRNHTDEAVTVKVFETMPSLDWTIADKSHDFEKKDVRTAIFPIEVKAHAESVLTYTVRARW